MADFVAVLKKTLDGLKDPSAEMREKVYAKARATIAAKLAAIEPKPAQSVIDRQMQALESAIDEVEASFRAADVDLDSEALDALLSDDMFKNPPPDKRSAEPVAPVSAPPPPPTPQVAPRQRDPVFDDLDDDEDADVTGGDWEGDDGDYDDEPARRGIGRKKRGLAGILLAVLVLLVVGGGGYALWLNKEPLLELAGLGSDATTVTTEDAGSEAVTAEDETAAAETDEAPESAETQKFTQRLLEDGREVDPGPAQEEAMLGEGTSVAAATQAEDGSPSQTTDGAAAAAIPAGSHKAIFYEERTSNAQGSADPGQVSWTLVEESPGGGLPPEPAIRGEATIPGKDIQFRMTIRRNGDESLPASHIIEMIFLVPDDFEGGAIDNVLRVALKETEQSPGNPLLGIPAKISDGFFLLALSDSNAEIQANNMMMRRLSWLDIPIVYRSGRRALITLEKGDSGTRVFEEALRAWAPDAAETSQ